MGGAGQVLVQPIQSSKLLVTQVTFGGTVARFEVDGHAGGSCVALVAEWALHIATNMGSGAHVLDFVRI